MKFTIEGYGNGEYDGKFGATVFDSTDYEPCIHLDGITDGWRLVGTKGHVSLKLSTALDHVCAIAHSHPEGFREPYHVTKAVTKAMLDAGEPPSGTTGFDSATGTTTYEAYPRQGGKATATRAFQYKDGTDKTTTLKFVDDVLGAGTTALGSTELQVARARITRQRRELKRLNKRLRLERLQAEEDRAARQASIDMISVRWKHLQKLLKDGGII